jgi:hypothetical protein
MAEPKTRPTNEDPFRFIDSRAPEEFRDDSRSLASLFEDITGEPAVMWGDAIIGYGRYLPPQKGASEWPLLAFSPRKTSITIYLMPGCATYAEELGRLGKHKASGSCLHIKRLSEVDQEVLREVCSKAFADMKARYNA